MWEVTIPPPGEPPAGDPGAPAPKPVRRRRKAPTAGPSRGKLRLPAYKPLPPRSPSPYDLFFAFRRIRLPHMQGLSYDELNGAQRSEVHVRWVYDAIVRDDLGGTDMYPSRVVETPVPSHSPPLSSPSVCCPNTSSSQVRRLTLVIRCLVLTPIARLSDAWRRSCVLVLLWRGERASPPQRRCCWFLFLLLRVVSSFLCINSTQKPGALVILTE